MANDNDARLQNATIKNAKNAIKFLCELCVVNTSRNNILIYIWQTLNPPATNGYNKKRKKRNPDYLFSLFSLS